MQILSLLGAVTDVMVLPEGYEIGLDWLGHFARIIIEGVGIVGLGIIVFNLVLKAITLPFDIYQRVKMRKQNLIMRQMQPELEKLQKQYAGDKQMYNQKMYELQKKNGYSMLGACLPMIVSLVILIVAWQGFRAYSQYANLQYYEKMSESYNAAVLANGVDGIDFTLKDEEGSLFLSYFENNEEKKIPLAWENGATVAGTPNGTEIAYTMTEISSSEKTAKYLTVTSTDPSDYIFYIYNLEADDITREYKIDLDRYVDVMENESPAVAEESVKDLPEAERMAAEARIEAKNAAIGAVQAYLASSQDDAAQKKLASAAQQYVERLGAIDAALRFRSDDPSFLWIKNVWYPDVSYQHPIPDYEDFSSEFRSVTVEYRGHEQAITGMIDQSRYTVLTSELANEKDEPNGYFILIVLSIGFMLLSQIVAMKSNKTSNKYQTVDGQGATTQKIMLVVMPLIYALFAFQYSAAFSIYMTMSSIVGIIVTLLCNFILGRIFKKKEEAETAAVYERKLPWMKDAEKQEKKKEKQGKTHKK